ncbi:phosphoribosyl-ATP diphosphatase [Candidatus Amarolinea aalborgensis]|jgi:phosphoribosyl-ATP pyrophosphohydrolase|uniref:phosphoribosyl-ATP diphosphatase n=1 Tax=Candidatus Amarolinea aalborgensis TaxID=2249329 RepID=UPI003BF9605A
MGHVIEDLTAVIEARKAQPPAGSYTAQLFAKGENEMLKKMGEEMVEVIVAAKGETTERVVYELADVVYHTLVFLSARGLSWATIEDELQRRFGH